MRRVDESMSLLTFFDLSTWILRLVLDRDRCGMFQKIAEAYTLEEITLAKTHCPRVARDEHLLLRTEFERFHLE
jgi:hypothetical protein